MDTKKLRQKILDLAIHGRLVPQDPNDEPASALLQRIREEKERLVKEGKIKRNKKTKAASDTNACGNELPQGWAWSTLGEIGLWQSGATPDRNCKDYYGGDIPWLKTGDLTDGLITNIPETITEKALSETSVKLNPKDSVLIAMYGATIGKVGILTFPATTNQACCACSEYGIEKMYLFYFLIANRENFVAMGGGGAQPNISKEKIVSTYIPLPPLPEQHRIVSEVERWFALIDKIEQSKTDLQAAVKQAKSKILDLAIHGKLVPQDPSDEPASELLRRINPAAACDKGGYGEVPSGWTTCRITDVAESLLGKTLDRTKDIGEEKDYLCALNVQWDNFDLTTLKRFKIEGKDFERYSVKEGDLLICEGGDVGRAAIWIEKREMYYQNALHRVRFKQDISARFFLYAFMYFKANGTIDSLCKGVTIKHFTQSTMNKIVFPLPPLPEQHRIVSKIEALFAQLDRIQTSLEA